MLDQDEESFEQRGVIESLRHQWQSSQKKYLIIKISIMTVILLLLLLNAIYNFIHHISSINCLKDVFQDWTLSITKYLEVHKSFKNWMIVASSAFVDINMFMLVLRWIWFGKSLRLFITTFSFYLFRAFLQRVFRLSFPDHYIFGDPGFFSIGVPYFKTSDFFYSGHVGLSTICFLEFKKDKSMFLEIFAVVGTFYNFFVLLVTRAHYFIDLVIGMLTAHYIFIVGLWFEQSIRKSKLIY